MAVVVLGLKYLPLDAIVDLTDGSGVDQLAALASRGVWRLEHPLGQPVEELGWFFDPSSVINARLTTTLVSGERRILYGGWLPLHRHSFVRTLDELHHSICLWPADEARRGETRTAAEGKPMPLVGESRMRSSGLRFLVKLGLRFLSSQLRALFLSEQWNIGVLSESPPSVMSGSRNAIDWLPSPKRGTFLADPFPLPGSGGKLLLAEYYDYANALGYITLVDTGTRGHAGDKRVIDVPVHASYPFVVEHDNNIYCIPESAQMSEVALFRSIELPLVWEKYKTLLEGVRLVDPTVFRYEGRWWMIGTDLNRRMFTALLVFFAEDLEGPWKAHPRNPVKFDVRSSRPAGAPFWFEDQLYRPAQDCSSKYGGAVVLNRIVQLSPQDFGEEVAARVDPEPRDRFGDGLHTLNFYEDGAVVDGKRMRFSLDSLLFQGRFRLKRLRGKPPRQQSQTTITATTGVAPRSITDDGARDGQLP
jgi:hypothetical protein